MEKYITANKGKTSGGSVDLLTLLKQKGHQSHPTLKVEPVKVAEELPSARKPTLANILNGSSSNLSKENNQNSSSSKLSSIHKAADGWEQREKDTISLMDLTGQQRLKQIEARKFTGWKVDGDGNKVYTTFRNGERVQASGQQGFMLAYGDGAIKKKSKDANKRPIDEVEVYVPESLPIQGPKPKKQVMDYFSTNTVS